MMLRSVERRRVGRWVPHFFACALWLVLCGSIDAAELSAGPIGEYRLVVGDVVEFDFLDDDEDPAELTVGNDGRIQVPLLGGIDVAGLSVLEAVARLRDEYIRREFLNDPKITLSISEYRPIFVIGDVRSPGSFPFQPLLTVEQAVGLAGGPLTILASQEDQILNRTRLRGELEETDSEIAREAIWAARLRAQLGSRTEIDIENVPEAARLFLNDLFVSALQSIEEQFLQTEAAAFAMQKSLLNEGIAEAEKELDLLEQLSKNQRENIEFSRNELERVRTLLSQGLITSSENARLERELSSEEGRLLTVLAQISQARRSIGELRGRLSELEANRRQDALLELQERQTNLQQLLSRRRALEDELALLRNWTSEEATDESDVVVSYTIRRRDGDIVEDQPAIPTATLSPGDVVWVIIGRSAMESL